MDYSTGKLAFIFVVAVALAVAGAWLLARRYRVAMRALMSAPLVVASSAARAAPMPSIALAPAVAVTEADNRRTAWCLSGVAVVLSGLIATSSGALQLVTMFPGDPFSVRRAAMLALVHLWPAIPALGVVWRWSRWRLAVTLGFWFLLCLAVIVWGSIKPMPLQVLGFLGLEIGPPLLVMAGLCLGHATRAIAPWLLPPVVGFVWASVAGIDLLGLMIRDRPSWLLVLPSWIGADALMALFVVLPWVLAWWPLKWFARGLARAYARKVLAELSVLFTAVWAISLFYQALGAASALGAGGAVMLLPLGWIFLALLLSRWLRRSAGRPPTLLVLRVYRLDAEVQQLFDSVIERWRLTGNTVLIAGTDLADRTLDADKIFTFLQGRLGSLFIREPADVAVRLAGFDFERDDDGRFRINECLCHDTTWQDALAALVQRSDLVLMDLRGFQAHNAGCAHELAVLANAARIRRVVVLADAATDRAAAHGAGAGAPADRFVWVDASRVGRRLTRVVLQQLFLGLAPNPAVHPRAQALAQ